LRPLVATALIPAGRGRQAAPRNQHSVEVDGEIEKSLTELFQPGADDQLPANVMDSQGGLVRQARVERAASNPAYSALAFMARTGTARHSRQCLKLIGKNLYFPKKITDQLRL
jgi:hypothetical protein